MTRKFMREAGSTMGRLAHILLGPQKNKSLVDAISAFRSGWAEAAWQGKIKKETVKQ